MPRGQAKDTRILSSHLSQSVGGPGGAWSPAGPAATPEERRRTIEANVAAFVDAWFAGDSAAMLRCLHPDYLHRLVAIDGRGEPPKDLLQSAVGVQGRFGRHTPAARRSLEVRILDVRQSSASAVAILGDWILQLHLARSGGQWCIVNAMWEMERQRGGYPSPRA